MREFNVVDNAPRVAQQQILRYLKEVDNIRAAKVLYDYYLVAGYDAYKQENEEIESF